MKSVMIVLSLLVMSNAALAEAPSIASKCRDKIVNSDGLDSSKVAKKGFAEGAGWYSFLIKAQDKTEGLKDMIFVCVKDNAIKHCLRESMDESEIINAASCE